MSIRVGTLCIVAGGLLATNVTPALAQRSSSQSGGHGSDIGLSIRVGTLGGGIELSKLIVSHVGVRLGGNYFSLSKDSIKQSNLNYSIKAKFQSFSALLDLYPSARGSFHLTAGLITSPVKFTGTGKSTGGTFDIGDGHYSAADVGTLSAEAKFASAEPYVGLGIGTAASKHGGVGFVFDLGAAIGKPKFSLSATNQSTTPGLQADLNKQSAKTQTDVNKLVAYPVLALGLMIRF